MALPTIRFHRFSTGAGNMSNLMMALHARLLEAGWVANFLSTAAIGTGTAADPRWNNTAAINTSAGRAIYIMPANGFVRQWHVEIDPRWGGSTNQLNFRIRVGLGSDAVGNITDTGPNTYNFHLTSTTSNNALETMIATSEDGLFVGILGSGFDNTIHMSIERARTLAGVVTEDLLIMGVSPVVTSGNLIGFISPCASIRRRASDGVEFTPRPMFLLGGLSSSGGFLSPNSALNNLAGIDGTVPVPAGPYTSGGEFSGCPRLFLYGYPSNIMLGSSQWVFVDGQQRIYRVQTASTTAIAVMVANE